MARFPLREAEIQALGQSVKAGLAQHPELFSTPPVAPAALETVLEWLAAAQAAVCSAQAAAQSATEAKLAVLAELSEALKTDLRYAANTVADDDASLKLLGWEPPRARRPLAPPGQTRSLHLAGIENDGLTLAWQGPAAGGKSAAYKLQRRLGGSETGWELLELALEPQAKLTHQPPASRLEYRVTAVNRAGESLPSNTVSIVL